MSRPDDDDLTNLSSNPHLLELVGERLPELSRRSLLRGGLGLGALGLLGGASLPACTDDLDGAESESDAELRRWPPRSLGFGAVAKSLADRVTVPCGYTATVLYALGDPLNEATPSYANDGTDPASSFASRAGDHHDGMRFFGMDRRGRHDARASRRGLLCINHEAITPLFLHPNGPTIVGGARTVAEEVDRELYLHGVSVVEVRRSPRGTWSYQPNSPYNRRIHAGTEMELTGPLRGAAALVTRFSPTATRTRGTVNNCANGFTPWGTYLTCEENWANYFRRVAATDNPSRSAKELTALARYSVAGNGRELWATVTPDTADQQYGRWNAMVRGATAAEDYRNVANTFGYVVEIDPFDPTSTPRKRTALGRFAHEGAVPARAVPGKPLVFYMGDDSRGEYIYKFVSEALWDPTDADADDKLAVGAKYLDRGTLYAARFSADGTGTWLELTFGKNNLTPDNPAYPFSDQADVALHSRLAADAAGATKMDRPEWGAVDPSSGTVYMTLTNNNAAVRSLAATDAANPRHYNDPKTVGGVTTAQWGNPNGHIIRWREPSAEATTFAWDIYLFGAAADSDRAGVNLSSLGNDNDFSSPDGLFFSAATGLLWIETDDGAYTDVTNCMLLAALPGDVGDGQRQEITSTDAAGNRKTVTAPVGRPPGTRLRRFLVGPRECEITGLAETPDGRALFVNIQHPGEDTPAAELASPHSTWPAGAAGARPRSATIVITRDDGGPIGL